MPLRLLVAAGGGGGSFPTDGLSPSATITATKAAGNPTFNFDAIPESMVKVGSTYWATYQGRWADGSWDIRLASATSRDGPWTAYAGNPVITGGVQAWESGTDVKVYSPEIMEDAGTFYIFYSAANAVNGTNGKIGVATATTVTGPYTKYASNPILSPGSSGAWDSLRVGEPSVLNHGGQWIMAYMGETTAAAFGLSEKGGIATASSPFGPWTKAAGNPVINHGADGQWDDDLVADPFLFYDRGFYWQWYSGGGSSGGTGTRKWHSGLAYATTPTGTWTKHTSNPILSAGSGTFDDQAAWRGSVWVEDNAYSGIYGGLNSDISTARGGNFRLTIG